MRLHIDPELENIGPGMVANLREDHPLGTGASCLGDCGTAARTVSSWRRYVGGLWMTAVYGKGMLASPR